MTASEIIDRKYSRHQLDNTFVVNELGICRIFNLSRGGISFGCVRKREVPERLRVDIIDDEGLHLLDLCLTTVWAARNKALQTSSSAYEMVVGAKFGDSLTPDQQSVLDRLVSLFGREVH